MRRSAVCGVLISCGALGCAPPAKGPAAPLPDSPRVEVPRVPSRDKGSSVAAPPTNEPAQPPAAEAPAQDEAPAANTATSAVGRLAPERIQSVVRANFDALRACYETGLKRDAQLRGRVGVRFVIGLDGRVSGVSDEGSDMPDREVLRCVLDGFRLLEFPRPDGGIVKVVYPIIFSPGS
jgi:hypothetical protein